MKNSIILQIFRGERGRYDMSPFIDREYRKQADEIYEKLEKKLSKEDFNLFNDFIDKDGFARCEEMDGYFLEGVKIGLRMGIECMDE
ncbi:MAG: hypothetical protein IKC91_02235 [Clostridia bacterium]|nr:hypothetical protein [Clostridia bacterium]